VIDFRQARLRSNPRFRLVPCDGLQTPELNAFGCLRDDPDFFGILVPPQASALPIKSVSRDAALLFLALTEPACLPHLLTSLFGSSANDRLRQLVLDGVFEVELEGQFASGPAVLQKLSHETCGHPSSRVAQLSSDAIAYAAALESLAVHDVAARLYLFNAVPSTLALHRRFASDDRLLSFLSESGDTARRLQSTWSSEPVSESWLAWFNAGPVPGETYKLYVSPMLDDLPAVFAIAVEAFAKVQCSHFKLGRGAYGALRPDKLVAYFARLDQLQTAAELIKASARGARAQGVPFSAPIDPDGLLSWGMDPPRFEQVLTWQQQQSWRQWLTGRIAVYAMGAKEAGTDVQAFVRRRIALDGVDPSDWTPDLGIWRGPAGAEQEVAA
jgi:hypothetical protein